MRELKNMILVLNLLSFLNLQGLSKCAI